MNSWHPLQGGSSAGPRATIHYTLYIHLYIILYIGHILYKYLYVTVSMLPVLARCGPLTVKLLCFFPNREAFDEFEILANSYRQSSQFSSKLFFVLIDIDDNGGDAFQSVSCVATGVISCSCRQVGGEGAALVIVVCELYCREI